MLVIALALDSVSRAVAVRQLRRQAAARGVTVRALLRETPDPTLLTVYLEDSIDVLGAALALLALVQFEERMDALPDRQSAGPERYYWALLAAIGMFEHRTSRMDHPTRS